MLSSREVVVGLRTWLGDRDPEDSAPILQQRLVPMYRTRTLLVSLVRLEGENPGRNIIIETRKKRPREYTMHKNLIFVQIEIFPLYNECWTMECKLNGCFLFIIGLARDISCQPRG